MNALLGLVTGGLAAIPIPEKFGKMIVFSVMTVLAGCTITALIKIGMGFKQWIRGEDAFAEIKSVDSQKYEFTATIEEGQALAFGGLTGLSNSKNESRVPVLGRIPLLGGLFKHTNEKGQQRNMIAYIIPTIVRAPVEAVPPVQLQGSHAMR